LKVLIGKETVRKEGRRGIQTKLTFPFRNWILASRVLMEKACERSKYKQKSENNNKEMKNEKKPKKRRIHYLGSVERKRRPSKHARKAKAVKKVQGFFPQMRMKKKPLLGQQHGRT
jgi:hypothetical protein